MVPAKSYHPVLLEYEAMETSKHQIRYRLSKNNTAGSFPLSQSFPIALLLTFIFPSSSFADFDNPSVADSNQPRIETTTNEIVDSETESASKDSSKPDSTKNKSKKYSTKEPNMKENKTKISKSLSKSSTKPSKPDKKLR